MERLPIDDFVPAILAAVRARDAGRTVTLLREHRDHAVDEQALRGIQITINGISAGLRNSG